MTPSRLHRFILVALSAAMIFAGNASAQDAVDTAFTYQGRLKIDGLLHDAPVDLCFSLYDSPAATTGLIAGPLPKEDVEVTKGLFSVELDFGAGVFTGEALWLEVKVRTNGSSGPITCNAGNVVALGQRQKITGAPYALNALTPWVFDPVSNDVSFTDGNVGIGTAAPADLLHVVLTNSYARFDRNILNSTPQVVINHGNPAGNSILSFRNQTAVKWDVGNIPALGDALQIATALEPKVVITQSGNVGVGVENPQYRVDVDGAIRATESVVGKEIELFSLDPFIDFHSSAQPPSDFTFRIINSSYTLKFQANSTDITMENGCVIAANTAACSDLRFKTDLTDISSALDLVERLRGVRFAWQRDEFPDRHFSAAPQIGFVAQEVGESVPEIVIEGSDGYLSVDYGRLTPVLVEAVKELHGIVQDKDAQLAAQGSRIDQQQQELDGLRTEMTQMREVIERLAQSSERAKP